MADSNITKRALAQALKSLMREMPFEKISITDICERCDMNRKSFYYHFRDKYDLANWIFDSEFSALLSLNAPESSRDFFTLLCEYLYDNADFYRKAFSIQGQNSFSEHFRSFLRPVLSDYIYQFSAKNDVDDFCISLFSDSLIVIIKRWLCDRSCLEPSVFISRFHSCVELLALRICPRQSNGQSNI